MTDNRYFERYYKMRSQVLYWGAGSMIALTAMIVSLVWNETTPGVGSMATTFAENQTIVMWLLGLVTGSLPVGYLICLLELRALAKTIRSNLRYGTFFPEQNRRFYDYSFPHFFLPVPFISWLILFNVVFYD
ncbi:MAG: hypothetical protein JKY60_02015 [Kordiimonadaceae bacterium]|nr:hypothetical protein [Kordiimonadaceae bacterium]